MNEETLNKMIEELEYSVEWHTKQLEEKTIQLIALQKMKGGSE
tara:strand:- start:24 stop:152 length:129 start_codon:yes stop_codon:yes gene_type:complete